MTDSQFSFADREGNRIFIDCFGSNEYFITVGKSTIRFEWSDIFGPLPITKTGAGRDLSYRHPFWRAASLWNLQGKRLEDGKNAIWHEPKKPVLKHLGGRHYQQIEPGEPGHDW